MASSQWSRAATRRTFGQRTEDCSLHATIEVLPPADLRGCGVRRHGRRRRGVHARLLAQRRPDCAAFASSSPTATSWRPWKAASAIATAPLRRVLHWLNRNSHGGSRRNIAAHYDLGNDLFALFLDETMAYSCGIFERDDSTLHEAQLAKFERICRKLHLSPADHLLEIGTGWGGLAIHAARSYGCRVTTTTISREQHDWAAERVARSGPRRPHHAAARGLPRPARAATTSSCRSR